MNCILPTKPAALETDPSRIPKAKSASFRLYIIPLAKKLKECGVFASSDEYLNYAMKNRKGVGSTRSRGRR
jgi:hypothetical protein